MRNETGLIFRQSVFQLRFMLSDSDWIMPFWNVVYVHNLPLGNQGISQ